MASVDDLVVYIERAARRQSELLAHAPWRVVELYADIGAEALGDAALDVIAGLDTRFDVT